MSLGEWWIQARAWIHGKRRRKSPGYVKIPRGYWKTVGYMG